MQKRFFCGGLRFTCQRCSACCRHEPGYVYISQNDIMLLANICGMSYTDFMKVYCRWIPMDDGKENLSLKEKANYDCIFWLNGSCSVYEARPAQCRAFPFWPSIVETGQGWSASGLGCPGIDQGEIHTEEEICFYLHLIEGTPPIKRERQNTNKVDVGVIGN